MNIVEDGKPISDHALARRGAPGDRLAHFGRLCAAGELAAGFAHELHQPLCSIALYAETCLRLLNDQTAEPAVLQDALGDVRREAMRAAEVIKQLRRFVRKQTPAVRPVPLRQIIDHALSMTDYDAKNLGVRVLVDVDPALPPVLVAPVQIEQVLFNLVRNALDAIAAERPAAPRVLIDAFRRTNGMVDITVHNTGRPVPEPIRKQMFQPFFSTKADGLGVGLYLARLIVTAHGGTIDCPASADGTTVLLTLPLARPSHAPTSDPQGR